ncbi:MAG: alpha/beta fold hydrolase [Pseudomonadota bacterium]
MAAWCGWPALLLISVLGACATGGPLAVPPGELGSDAESDPTTGLALSRWEAAEPKALILAVHGYGDYGASTFAMAGPWWAERGLTTIAYDQRGFGRNASRGYWPGVGALVEDLTQITASLRARHPCLPIVVVGHSMGGGVTLAAAPGLAADGIVLAAPAIWGQEELNPFHRLLAWTAASIVPEKRFTGKGVVRIQASDNLAVLRGLARDPLYLRPPSAREIFGLVRVTDRAALASPAVTLPAILLLGARDEIVPNDAVERVFARTAGPRQIRRYDEGWHLLFRDLQAEAVWRDVAEWVETLEPPEGCAIDLAVSGQGAGREIPSVAALRP